MCRKPNRLHSRPIGYKKAHDPTVRWLTKADRCWSIEPNMKKYMFCRTPTRPSEQNSFIYYIHKHYRDGNFLERAHIFIVYRVFAFFQWKSENIMRNISLAGFFRFPLSSLLNIKTFLNDIGDKMKGERCLKISI